MDDFARTAQMVRKSAVNVSGIRGAATEEGRRRIRKSGGVLVEAQAQLRAPPRPECQSRRCRRGVPERRSGSIRHRAGENHHTAVAARRLVRDRGAGRRGHVVQQGGALHQHAPAIVRRASCQAASARSTSASTASSLLPNSPVK